MEELIELKQRPQIPASWDYQKSVIQVKQQIYKWKSLTEDIATELWIAKEKLKYSRQHSWSEYCQAIGSSRQVINRWLNRYFEKEKVEQKFHIPLPLGKYRVIYADPPWQYDNSGFEDSAEAHYPTMSTEEICNLAVKDLVGEDAVLFLWVTSPFLKEGFQVIEKWGFEYKTNFVWVKDKNTVGFYHRSQHEFLLVATKGSCLPEGEDLSSSVIFADRAKHSEKPKAVYEIIEQMYDPPYIELFARNKRKDWDSWGNEI